MDIKISKSNYADLMRLIDRAYDIITQNGPPPRDYNVARRLRLIMRQIKKQNPMNLV